MTQQAAPSVNFISNREWDFLALVGESICLKMMSLDSAVSAASISFSHEYKKKAWVGNVGNVVSGRVLW
jgi:hypothetical protein